MNNNLTPPFIMRKAGIIVNNTSKMYLVDPDILYYSILFNESKVRIPMSLLEIFSYLLTTHPSATMLNDCEEVYILTPGRCYPHNPVYSSNERNMLS